MRANRASQNDDCAVENSDQVSKSMRVNCAPSGRHSKNLGFAAFDLEIKKRNMSGNC